jgi:hypothetical protein
MQKARAGAASAAEAARIAVGFFGGSLARGAILSLGGH